MTEAIQRDIERLHEAREVAESTLVGDLIQATLDELRAAPDVWQRMSEQTQGDVIERMEKRVKAVATQAINILATQDRPAILANLEQLTAKDGVKVVLKMRRGDPGFHDLADAAGEDVLIVLPHAEQTVEQPAGVDPDPDQPGLPLGGFDEGPADTEVKGADEDLLLDRAINEVVQTQTCTVSQIQRALKVGYNRAARLVERMEALGTVTPMNQDGVREVQEISAILPSGILDTLRPWAPNANGQDLVAAGTRLFGMSDNWHTEDTWEMVLNGAGAAADIAGPGGFIHGEIRDAFDDHWDDKLFATAADYLVSLGVVTMESEPWRGYRVADWLIRAVHGQAPGDKPAEADSGPTMVREELQNTLEHAKIWLKNSASVDMADIPFRTEELLQDMAEDLGCHESDARWVIERLKEEGFIEEATHPDAPDAGAYRLVDHGHQDQEAAANPFADANGVGAVDAAGRMEMVDRFDLEQCQAGLAVPGLQKTVEKKLRSRIRKLEEA